MIDQKEVRLEKYVREATIRGGVLPSLAELSKRFDTAQRTLLTIITNHPNMDFEVGYLDEDNEYVGHTYIGNYRVRWVDEWNKLHEALTYFRGRHQSAEVNHAIERLLELL